MGLLLFVEDDGMVEQCPRQVFIITFLLIILPAEENQRIRLRKKSAAMQGLRIEQPVECPVSLIHLGVVPTGSKHPHYRVGMLEYRLLCPLEELTVGLLRRAAHNEEA